jgi:predicted branched-subunit amino acid permease
MWAVIGGSAALLFGMTPDFALIGVGIIAFLFLVISRFRTRQEAE